MTAKLVSATTILAALCLATAPAAGAAHKRHGTNITRAKVSAGGSTVTVRGKVRLRHNTRATRRHARVRLVLSGGGRTQHWKAKLTSRRTFRKRLRTAQRGHLVLRLRVLVRGRRVGRQVRRRFTLRDAPTSGPLVGTFKLKAGSAPAGDAPRGTWFQMLTSGGGPLSNFSSPAGNKNYTPLSPGSDGGLRTDAFQGPPARPFSGGDARADRIVRPASFFGTNFSVVTAATDAQTGQRDPLPAIRRDGGRLGGQVTAWVAQWNGQSFNQGTPKPDGTRPAPTSPVQGTYDAATGAFTLAWRSRIVGGPFNGFTGAWHLEGTFVPRN